MTQKSENFDRLLDQALHSYSSSEPRFGLEDRIVARTAAERASQRGSAWFHHQLRLGVIAAVAGAIAAAILMHQQRPIAPETLAHNTPARAPSLSAPLPRTVPAQHHERSVRVTRPLLRPRIETAGLPTLTPQERLLAQFASAHPGDALALSSLQAKANRPLVDRPLVAMPLADGPISIEPIPGNPIDIAPIDPVLAQKPSF